MSYATAADIRKVTKIVEDSGSSFTLGMKFIAEEKRRYLFAVYAFCRVIDDVADSPVLTIEEKKQQLDYWTHKIDDLAQDRANCPITRLLHDAKIDHALPLAELYHMLDGMRADVKNTVRLDSWQDLYDYCRKVAVSAGIMTLSIFDRHDPEAHAFAHDVGYALQLTNILRDVDEDWRMGRCYIPQALADEHDITLCNHGQTILPLLNEIAQKAKAHYQAAHAALDVIPQDNLSCACIMMIAYEAVFNKMQKRGFHILSPRVSLSPFEKTALMTKALRYL